MVYNNDIPRANDNLSISQGDILGDFGAIDAGTTGSGIGFSRNHITMIDATNGGLHYRVDFYQAVASPTLTGFTSSLYAKTVSAISELFYKNGTADIQLTKGAPNITGNATGTSKGHSFLPGGALIQWGSLAATTSGVAFTFDVSFTTIYSITCGIQAGGAQSVAFSNVTNTGATVRSQSGTQEINYIAIGI